MPCVFAITRVNVGPETEHPVFGEGVISMDLEDEAGGVFFLIKQDENTIRISSDELQLLANAARRMLRQPWVRKHDREE